MEGIPGQTYRLESRGDLTLGAWKVEARVTLTQATHVFDLPIGNSGSRLFRAVVE